METRLERIAAGKKIKGETLVEQAALRRCQAALDAGQPLLEAGLTDEEWQAVRSLGFLTVKPALVVVNIDEDQLHRGGYPGAAELDAYASARSIPVLTHLRPTGVGDCQPGGGRALGFSQRHGDRRAGDQPGGPGDVRPPGADLLPHRR